MQPEQKSNPVPKKKIKYIQKTPKYDKATHTQNKIQALETRFEQKQEHLFAQSGKLQTTTVINISVRCLRQLGYNSLEQWLQNPNHIYIGRNMSHYVPGAVQSKWANPFKVDKYGRQGCIKEYKEYLMSREDLMKEIGFLKGKVLGCWCKPEGCHGDILVQLTQKQE